MRGVYAILVTGLIGFTIWQALIWIFDFKPFILPTPISTLEAVWTYRALIAEGALYTIAEVAIGLVLGVLLGVATALQLSSSRFAEQHVRPLLVFLQAIPIFALAPIFMIWFGFGIWPKIFVVVLVTYFPVASALFDGLRTTPPGYLDLARAAGARPMGVLWHVRFPAAVPALCSGLRLAAVYAPIGAFIGEWVGASNGLGALMVYANGRIKIDLLFAALYVFATFTVLLHAGTDRFCRHLTERFT